MKMKSGVPFDLKANPLGFQRFLNHLAWTAHERAAVLSTSNPKKVRIGFKMGPNDLFGTLNDSNVR